MSKDIEVSTRVKVEVSIIDIKGEVTGLHGKSGYLCPLVAWVHISRKSLSHLGRAGT